MNHTPQNRQREQAYCRSCLESSPGCPGSWTLSQLHQLKRRLLHLALQETSAARLLKTLCGAANQAADLAWNTSFPLLVFPGLFEELARIAGKQFHQEQAWLADNRSIFPIRERETHHDDVHPFTIPSRWRVHSGKNHRVECGNATPLQPVYLRLRPKTPTQCQTSV